MAQLNINIGSNANDGTGDDLRAAMQKINTNFTELYGASPVSSQITIAGNEIVANQSNANLKLSASGTGVIEFEAIQIRDNHIEATRSNDDLVLSASGTGAISLDALQIKGTTLSSTDSSSININENVDIDGSLTVSGTLTMTTVSGEALVANTIRSDDSSAVTVTDNLNVNGTLTATNITGVTALTQGDVSDGSATTNSSTIANLDTFAAATFRSAQYEVSISDSTNARYALVSIRVTHDGTNAYINDTVVSSTGGNMATFTADIDSGNVRVRIVPISQDSTTYKFVRTAINV